VPLSTQLKRTIVSKLESAPVVSASAFVIKSNILIPAVNVIVTAVVQSPFSSNVKILSSL